MPPSPDFPPPLLRVVTTLAFLGAFIVLVVQGRPLPDEAVLGLLTIASLARLQDLEEVSVWRLFRMTFRRRMSGEWHELRPPARAEELEEDSESETEGEAFVDALADEEVG